MKARLIILAFLFMAFGCAPTAEFTRFDVYDSYPFVYNENGIKDMPPDVLKEGEGWAWRIGDVKRTYRPRKKFDYYTTVIIVGNRDYEYTYVVKGKLDVRTGTRCYHMRENISGEMKHYLIIGTHKYEI